MKKVVLSAFACNPTKGSESSYGWLWSIGLMNLGFEVHTFTREINRAEIENEEIIPNLHIHYLKLPNIVEKLYSFSNITMYFYYFIWQWKLYLRIKKIHKIEKFDLIHHITWGSIQQGSFLYKLSIPFIFGPVGGGQYAPPKYKEFFKVYWRDEVKRKLISKLFFNFNPACFKTIRKADIILVSNIETYNLVKKFNPRKVEICLDTIISNKHFPINNLERNIDKTEIKLLWVGRFLPRKGLLLTIEVMKELKKYQNIKLTIVGDGPMMNYVRELIGKYELSSTVELIGRIPYDAVKNYYQTHDVFFYTSLRESGGVQLIEAMSFGLPIVTIDLHGQGQIVNEQVGYKIPVEEPEVTIKNLANSIIEISQNSLQYKYLSNNAYAFAKQQISEMKILEIVKKYY